MPAPDIPTTRCPHRRRWLAACLLGSLGPRAWAQVPSIGQAAPGFKLQAVDGQVHDLGGLVRQHRATVLNFWATWCGPCIVELPEFEEVLRRYRPQGLAMVAINAGEKAEKVLAFAKERQFTMPLLLDPDGQAREAYAVFSALPATMVIDRHGILRHRVMAPLSGAALRALVEPLLAAKG